MITIDLACKINRPVDEVWKYLMNPSIAKQWMSGLLQASSTAEGPWDVGTQFRKVQRFMGVRTEIVYDTTAYEPNRRLAYRTVSGTLSRFLSYEASITLKSIDSGTNLIYRGRGELRGFFRPVEPIASYWARKRFKRDFNTFKKILETSATSVIS